MFEELMDIVSIPKTYAEIRPSPFDAQREYALTELVKLLKPVARSPLGSAKRKATAQAAIDALRHINAVRGVQRFLGAKAHKVYIAAARDCEWFVYKSPKKEAQPAKDEQPCPRCKEVKAMSDFTAPATAAQRRAYKWPDGYRPYVAQRLCKPCRATKARLDSYAAGRAQVRRELKAPSSEAQKQWLLLRLHVQKELAATRAAFQSRKGVIRTPDGQFVQHRWQSDEMREYYEERMRLIGVARDALKELTLQGEIREDISAPVWYALVDGVDKERLAGLYKRVYWTTKGKQPVLWN